MSDYDKLKEVVRFEVDPAIFEDADYDEMKYDATYTPTYLDFEAACHNMIKAEVDISIVGEWLFLVSKILGDNYNGVFKANNRFSDYSLPQTDDEVFYDIYSILHSAIYIFSELFETPEATRQPLNDLIEVAENYRYNIEHDPSEWKIARVQTTRIADRLFKDNQDYSKIPEELLGLARISVDTGCKAGSPQAIIIKAYSLYGGNRLYECDWEESRKYLMYLFEKYGDLDAANSLRYIYYYGRCNDGKSEYEKAFYYFSIGAAAGITESRYKIADMLRDGKGCGKSKDAAENIVQKLFDEAEFDFCNGFDASFADVALRKASSCKGNKDYFVSMFYYLVAQYAIDKLHTGWNRCFYLTARQSLI